MKNKSEIHWNKNGTTSLVNNFGDSMNAWREETCMGTRNNTEREESAIAKRVNKNFIFNVNSSNTDRPVNPTVDNNKSLSRNNTAEERDEHDVFPSVTAHRLQNAKNVTIGALNVNSLRNKIGAVQELITNNIDICLLSETKIDENFPNKQFNISNYKAFCRYRNKHGGRLLFYINENIPCKHINGEIIPSDIEMIMFEFLVKTRKWLCIGLYKSPSQNENYFLDILSKVLSKQTCQYENVMLIGDFNLTVNNKNLRLFVNIFNLDSLTNKPTCFQSANPTCIDLILTNKKNLFKNSNVLEVGISDHHSSDQLQL